MRQTDSQIRLTKKLRKQWMESVDKTSNEAEINERFMRDTALVVYVRLLDGI